MLSRIANRRRIHTAVHNFWGRPSMPGEQSFSLCRSLLGEKIGLEIGGPSGICSRAGELPIYPLFQRLDNCSLSESTVGEGGLREGLNFRYDEARQPGRQYIRDAVDLHGIPSVKYDFVLSSQVLEHIANPLKAMREWLRVLKDFGTLVLIVPHKDGTFDHHRPVTPLSHLVEDYERNVGEDDSTHLSEILALHDLELDPWAGGFEDFKKRSQNNVENRCLHQHVFDTELAVAVMDHVGLRIQHVECLKPYNIIVIGQKLPAAEVPDNHAFLNGSTRFSKHSPFLSDRPQRARARVRRAAARACRLLWQRCRSRLGRVRRWGRARLGALRRRLRPERSAPISQHGIVPVDTVSAAAPVPPHEAPVDVIVCVHNALQDVQRCLTSVVRHTSAPYSLILVDDGSDRPTRQYVAEFARSQDAVLIRNEQPRGYTKAANQGLRGGTGKYSILLNSDTVVVPQWLDRMVACAESAPGIGLVSPLSNTASWQSVPDLFDERGDWAENGLARGTSVTDMGRLMARYSGRLYPRLPFLNGFCLMIRRDTLEQVGHFDETAFAEGYGEENDYCLRAREAGWELRVADDVYIHHFQSRSYSHERRKQLASRADRQLADMHGPQTISDGANQCRFDRIMHGIRARSRVASERERLIQDGLRRWEGARVAFVLPLTTACGGGHVVIQEAKAMQQMGVDVRLVNLRAHREVFERDHPENPIPLIYLDGPHLAGDFLSRCDAIIATASCTVDWLAEFHPPALTPVKAYYVQDYEPLFFPDDSDLRRVAKDSYTRIPGLVRITKTQWNRRMVREHIGVDCEVVGPSVDIDLFRTRITRESDRCNGPLRVAAMVRPSTPRRAAKLTVEVLGKLSHRNPDAVEVVLFGCRPDDPDFQQLPTDFAWRHAGHLTRPQLARLMDDVDVFADFSRFQAMGLTAMEAMACGTAVIVPREGGTDSFATHEANALIADTQSPDLCLAALQRLLDDASLRSSLQQRAVDDVCRHTPEVAAHRILAALFPTNHPWNRR